jgi:hypothetical protein
MTYIYSTHYDFYGFWCLIFIIISNVLVPKAVDTRARTTKMMSISVSRLACAVLHHAINHISRANTDLTLGRFSHHTRLARHLVCGTDVRLRTRQEAKRAAPAPRCTPDTSRQHMCQRREIENRECGAGRRGQAVRGEGRWGLGMKKGLQIRGAGEIGPRIQS